MLVQNVGIVQPVEDLNAADQIQHSFVGLMNGIECVPKHGRVCEADDVRMRNDRKACFVFAYIPKEGIEIRGKGISLLVDDNDLAAVILIEPDGIFVIKILTNSLQAVTLFLIRIRN